MFSVRTKLRVVILCGVIGVLVLSGCASDGIDSEFTLPIVNSVAETTVPTATSSTLPIFEELYTVQDGDTLFEIAQAFGVTMDDLISYNGIADPDAIEAGQVLKVPSPTKPGALASSTTMAP